MLLVSKKEKEKTENYNNVFHLDCRNKYLIMDHLKIQKSLSNKVDFIVVP